MTISNTLRPSYEFFLGLGGYTPHLESGGVNILLSKTPLKGMSAMKTTNSQLSDVIGYALYGLLTCVIIIFVWSALEQFAEGTPWLGSAFEFLSNSDFPFVLTAAAVALTTITAKILIGFVSKKLIWNRLADMPAFASLTSSMDQVTQRLVAGESERQDRVVWVHWPSQELQTIGIVTASAARPGQTSDWLTVVILPTAGKVTGGSLRRVRPENVSASNWSINEALAFVSSSGTTGNILKDQAGEID
ncbi:MAG: DUF502 domain-containing protein [Planctomycetota bacterium]